MKNAISYRQVLAALQGNGQVYGVLTLQAGVRIIVTRRGGRVLGPFLDEDAASLLWINAALASPAALADFIADDQWNLGGDRIWIAPEIQYNVHDRTDFWGTLHLPEQIDPGQYTLEACHGGWRLTQAVTLEAHNLASGSKHLTLEREISLTADPLRALRDYDALLHGVTFAGYTQTTLLSENTSDIIVSETWNLAQLNPGGSLVIPVTAAPECSRYVGDVPVEALEAQEHRLCIPITGQQQYKVGYKAAYVTGRMGYFHTLEDGRSYLLVRSFNNDPSAHYSEEPPDQPGVNGHSIHVYNDGAGGFGGFGEMECNGQAIGGPTGRTYSADTFTMWLYVGDAAQIRRIGHILLGATP